MIQAVELGQPGQRYILGHQKGNLDLDDFLALLSQASDLPIPQPPRPGLRTRAKALLRRSQPRPATSESPSLGAAPDRLTCNPARAVTELNMPQSDLLTAARKQVEWYREQGFV